MAQRGILEEDVVLLLRFAESFSYNQNGVTHVGHYDEASRLFVAVVKNRVVTTFRTRPTYVERLRRSVP